MSPVLGQCADNLLTGRQCEKCNIFRLSCAVHYLKRIFNPVNEKPSHQDLNLITTTIKHLIVAPFPAVPTFMHDETCLKKQIRREKAIKSTIKCF